MIKRMKISKGRIAFNAINALILGSFTLLFIALFLHIIALSLSANDAIVAGDVGLFPVMPTLKAYKTLLKNSLFWSAFVISLQRVGLGILINMSIVILCAYPLSKTSDKMSSRNFYMWFFFFTALFSGGVIPLYIVVGQLGLLNTRWSLVLPSAVSVFNIILLLNFIRSLPKEMLEAADVDGASEIIKLIRIVLPCSLPSLATILLFTIVGHWNSWFDGMLFSTSIKYYPLQSYMQMIVVQGDFTSAGITDSESLELASVTMKTAQIIVAMIPVLIVYPLFQRFFMTGIVIGSVKG